MGEVRFKRTNIWGRLREVKTIKLGFLMLILMISMYHFHTSDVYAANSKAAGVTMQVYVGKDASLYDYLESNLKLQALMEDASEIKGSSSNSKIATVSSNGIVKGIKAGKTQITVELISYSYNGYDFATESTKKQITVQVLPYDGSTDSEAFEYSIKNEEVVITGCEVQKKDLIIPKIINGYPVTAISPSAFSGLTKVESISILGNVKTIGKTAFEDCSKLKTITLCDTVQKLGEYTFAGCKKLEKVVLSKQLTLVPEGAFSDCIKLKNIEFTENIRTIGDFAFYNCKSLKTIVIPGNILSIGQYAFEYCTGLEKVVWSDYLCQIGDRAFKDCSSLESVTLQKSSSKKPADTTLKANEKFGKDKDAFGYSLFEECYSIKTVEIPRGFTKIGDGSFSNCKGIENVLLPETITSIGRYAFESCEALQNINLPEGLTTIKEGAFFICSALPSMIIPDGVKTIEHGAFFHCNSMTKVVIPDSVTEIGESAFADCSLLTDIKVNNDVKRKVGDYVLTNTPYGAITKAYTHNLTFHFTEQNWTDLKLILAAADEMKIQSTDSDVEIIRKVHDWMVTNVSYSLKQSGRYENDYSAIQIVLEKRFAICGTYSAVFYQFMNLYDIDCTVVSSEAMDHAWNMVKLDDGSWYHIDVTWDDPGSNDESWEKGYLSYANLLRDDEGIKSTGHHDWQTDAPVANGEKYLNYFDVKYCIKFE